jgi:hypothetical protein
MESVNNEYLSRISTEQLFNESLEWAKKYKLELANLMEQNIEYTKAALNIERHTEKDPKRFSTFKDVDAQLRFFFDSEYKKLIQNSEFKIQNFGFDVDNLSKFMYEYL